MDRRSFLKGTAAFPLASAVAPYTAQATPHRHGAEGKTITKVGPTSFFEMALRKPLNGIARTLLAELSTSEPLLHDLPLINLLGSSLAYNVEGTLPGVAFRGYSESYHAGCRIINPACEALKIVGEHFDTPAAHVEHRSSTDKMAMRQVGASLVHAIINGSSYTDGPRMIDGLCARLSARAIIHRTFNPVKTLETLFDATDCVPTHLVMDRMTARKLMKAHRDNELRDWCVSWTAWENAVSRAFHMSIQNRNKGYNVVVAPTVVDPNNPKKRVMPGNSVLGLRLEEGYVQGIINGDWEVTDLGLHGGNYRTRLEGLFGLAVLHGDSMTLIRDSA